MSQAPQQFQSVAEAVHAVAQAIGNSDFERAGAMASAALADGLIHPALHNATALWLERKGQDEEALTAFQRARALAPKDVMIQNAIGLCLMRLNRLSESLGILDGAIALQPAYAPSYQRKGMALDRLGRSFEAETAYKRAVSLQPDNVEALAALASGAAQAGETAKATGYAERALRLDPENVTALTSLALIDLVDGAFDSAEKRLRPLSERPDVSGRAHAVVVGRLGDALHGQRRPHEAFQAWTSANDQLRRVHAARFPDGGGLADLAQHLLANLDAFAGTSRPASAPDTAAPGVAGHVFLLGFHRSGTTLLEQILKRHDGVTTAEEHDFLAESANRYLTTRTGMEHLATLPADDLDRARQQYWKGVAELHLNLTGKVFVDKHPLNTVKLPLIRTLFPDAKILFSIRDPRDVILSCFRGHFEINAAMYEHLTLAGSARLYDRVMQLAGHWRERSPEAFFDCRYERVIEEFDGTTRAICGFLNVPWQEGLRDFAASARRIEIRSPSASQVRRGIYPDSIGVWRRYVEELAPVLPVLNPWAERLGYPAA